MHVYVKLEGVEFPVLFVTQCTRPLQVVRVTVRAPVLVHVLAHGVQEEADLTREYYLGVRGDPGRRRLVHPDHLNPSCGRVVRVVVTLDVRYSLQLVTSDLRALHLAARDEGVVPEDVGFDTSDGRNSLVAENTNEMIPLPMLDQVFLQYHAGDLCLTYPTVPDELSRFFGEEVTELSGWIIREREGFGEEEVLVAL